MLWPWNDPEHNDKPSDSLSTRCWRASAAMCGSPEQLALGSPTKATQRPDVFSGFLRNFGRPAVWCLHIMFTTYSILYSYFDHINIILKTFDHIYIYIFNIIFITIHKLFKTSRVRFSRRETNGRSSTSDFAATTSGSSCFSWFDGSECSIV